MTTVDAWRMGFQARPLPEGSAPELLSAWQIGRARAQGLPLPVPSSAPTSEPLDLAR